MSRDPGSVWAPLPEAGAPDGMVKDKFIVHSTGDNGTAAATRRFFELAATVTESTFIIGWGPDDPTLQIMDTTDIADANVGANRSGISVEVVGDGKSGYNAHQRSELLRLAAFARREHPLILPRVCPSPTAAGFGWHVMFGAPGPWAAVAKECPGKQRIKELQADIFPAIFAGQANAQEDDMFSDKDREDLQYLKVAFAATLDARPDAPLSNSNGEMSKRIRDIHGIVAALAARDPEVDIDAETIAAAIPADLAQQVVDELAARLSNS